MLKGRLKRMDLIRYLGFRVILSRVELTVNREIEEDASETISGVNG